MDIFTILWMFEIQNSRQSQFLNSYLIVINFDWLEIVKPKLICIVQHAIVTN